MANPYYTHTTFPTPNSKTSSAAMRAEFDLINAGFDKLPVLTGNANKVVKVNAAGDALVPATAGTDYQTPLVSGTSIKTVNSTSLLGSGDIAVQTPLVSGTSIKTVGGASLLGSGDIALPTGDVTLTGAQTLTNKTLTAPVITGYTETVYSLSGTDIAPANGTVQTKTLSANTTFTESINDGQSVVLMLNPATYTVTWPATSWVNASGTNTAPTLKASVMNTVVFWQVGGTLYGNWIGSL